MDTRLAQSTLAFVEQAALASRGARSREALAEINTRYQTIEEAIRWWSAAGQVDDAFRLANAMIPVWLSTKRLDEGYSILHALTAQTGGDIALRAMALYGAGYLVFWKGEDGQAAEKFESALTLARGINDENVIALALAGQARIALRTDVAQARKLCREALAIATGPQAHAGRSSAMHVLAAGASMAGDLHEAKDLMLQRIDLAREKGDLLIIGVECGNLSMVERQLGNIDRAEELVHEAMDLACDRGDEMMAAWLMNGFAAVAADRKQFHRAAKVLGCADAALTACGGAWPPDEKEMYDRTVAAATAFLGEAAYRATWSEGHTMAANEALAFVRARNS